MTPPDLRVADPGDYHALVDFHLREQPHLERPEIAPALLDDTLTLARSVLTAYDGGELVGCGLLAHLAFHAPDRRHLRVVVAKAHRGRGIGCALMSALTREVSDDVRGLRSFTYDDDPRSVAIAERWGYARVQRSMTSRLPLAAVSEPTLPDGVSLTSHPDFEFPDPEAVEAMLDASQTNPERDHYGVMTLAQLTDMRVAGETPLVVLLRVGGVPAALTCGAVAGDISYVGYTGVDPAYRGRGLAVLAKQALHVEARRLGATWCFTENEENNAGIRRVNTQMGYVVLFGVWRHELLRG